jgi:hypothetical protein
MWSIDWKRDKNGINTGLFHIKTGLLGNGRKNTIFYFRKYENGISQIRKRTEKYRKRNGTVREKFLPFSSLRTTTYRSYKAGPTSSFLFTSGSFRRKQVLCREWLVPTGESSNRRRKAAGERRERIHLHRLHGKHHHVPHGKRAWPWWWWFLPLLPYSLKVGGWACSSLSASSAVSRSHPWRRRTGGHRLPGPGPAAQLWIRIHGKHENLCLI